MKTILLLLALLCCSKQLLAQQTLNTKNVTIFKNGLCMFTKEGTLPVNNGVIRLPIPEVINSTYWLGALSTEKLNGEKLIRNVVFTTDTIKTSRNAESWEELFRAGIGKHISLTLERTEKLNDSAYKITQNINGKLLRYMRGLNSVQLESPTGTRIIKLNGEIVDATIGGETSVTSDSTARFALITPTKAVRELTLQEMSLRQGVTWIPSYYLKLMEAKGDAKREGRIEMKALIENYADDIINADVELVVGLPQLYYSVAVDPVTFQESSIAFTPLQRSISRYSPTISTFGTQDVQVATGNYGAAYGGTVNGYASNQVAARRGGISIRGGRAENTTTIINGQNITDYVGAGGSGMGAAASIANAQYAAIDETFAPEAAESTADFFVYKLSGITIPKEKKGSASVFAATVGYGDKYECSIPDFVNFQAMRYINTQQDHSFDVFHSIELTNNSEYPLTTAGIVVIDEKNRFLTQDLLKYIPKGGKGFVRLSRELNVKVKSGEEEFAREENAEKINKVRYNKVSIRGSIFLRNYNDKEMTITVKKSINGTVTKEGEGKAKKLIENLGVNPVSELSYEVTIPANGKKELSYEYEALFQQ